MNNDSNLRTLVLGGLAAYAIYALVLKDQGGISGLFNLGQYNDQNKGSVNSRNLVEYTYPAFVSNPYLPQAQEVTYVQPMRIHPQAMNIY